MEKEKLDKANNISFGMNCCKNHILLFENAKEFEFVYIGEEPEFKIHTIPLSLKNDEKVNKAYQLFLDTLLTIEKDKLAELQKQFDEL